MPRTIDPSDIPEEVARFAEAQVAAGRFASVGDVLLAGVEALRRHGLRPPPERKLDGGPDGPELTRKERWGGWARATAQLQPHVGLRLPSQHLARSLEQPQTPP
jgi:hypothetical protein